MSQSGAKIGAETEKNRHCTKKYKKIQKKCVKFGLLVGLIYSRIVVGRWYLVVRILSDRAV
jgi:hypothetical protein